MIGTVEKRFWAKVDKSGECWNWTASKDVKGYGKLRVGGRQENGGRAIGAHRISYEIANGPIADGLYIDHTCHNSSCVRPAHLRLATPKQNLENLRGANRNSKSGVRGVWWSKQKHRWTAQVTHNWEFFYVGMFKTIEEAEAAAIAKRNELYTHNDADKKKAA